CYLETSSYTFAGGVVEEVGAISIGVASPEIYIRILSRVVRSKEKIPSGEGDAKPFKREPLNPRFRNVPREVYVAEANPPEIFFNIQVGILNGRSIPSFTFDDFDVINSSIAELHTLKHKWIVAIFGDFRYSVRYHLRMGTVVDVELVTGVEKERQCEALVCD